MDVLSAGLGFDNEKYLEEQTRSITERAERIGGKLYLEFGGKIAYDFHAARVLPGYDPTSRSGCYGSSKTRPRSSSACTPGR